jgi:AcrR family transcriptional regulator
MNNQHNFKQLDKSVRKQKIINTAAALFHRKGYSSTSLDDVSKELGITKAAIYHYVKNKDELLSIIYTQAFENIFRDTYEISAMQLSPEEKLRRIIRNHIHNIIIKDLSMFSVFFSEETQLPKKDFLKIRKEKKKYTNIIEEIINEGISKGLFKKVDPKLQAYAILGMCNWIYKWYNPNKAVYSPEQIADHFIILIESGYLTNDRKKSFENLILSKGAHKKSKFEIKKQIYKKLKLQCKSLIKLIDELEK